MRIEELVIDGFKSYPVRTPITGWDSSFNAITGLNGSGKSNILDAICFVLGSTNYASMRASNLQDLIYKRGQAGVTKASVTIVFDNSDPATSPEAYKDSPQITVTRQITPQNATKYLLNGLKADAAKVQNLFQSIQLNINNPNFVIMQGRITKVLNMRPQEILGMVEEAAGTRMFEMQKEKARKNMARKDKKIDSYKQQLDDDIRPTLDRLREDKRQLIEYQKAVAELEKVEKTLRASEWYAFKQREDAVREEMQAIEEEITRLRGTMEDLHETIQQHEHKISQVQTQRAKEVKKDGKLAQLRESVGDLDMEITKLGTKVELARDNIEEEEGNLKDAETEFLKIKEDRDKKQEVLNTLQKTAKKAVDAHSDASTKLAGDENLLQSLQTSSGSKSNRAGYVAQLQIARSAQTEAKAEEDQADFRLKEAQRSLSEKKTRLVDAEKNLKANKTRIQDAEGRLAAQIEALAKCGWDDDKDSNFQRRRKEAHDEQRRATERRDVAQRACPSLQFYYNAPPQFRKHMVHGKLAKLFSVADENMNKSLALEIAAGARLNNVVVDDEVVGKELLKLKLGGRITLIPLAKIQARKIEDSKIRAAKKIAPGKVHLALDLIEYDKPMEKAMMFAFGTTFICDTPDVAKQVTFDPSVKARSVTLGGDIYDPNGTLSGGAPPASSGLIKDAQGLVRAERNLRAAMEQVNELTKEEERISGARKKWEETKRAIEMQQHDLDLVKRDMDGEWATQLSAEILATEKQIAEEKEIKVEAKQKQVAAEEECKQIERDMEEFKDDKKGKIRELKERITKQKADLQKTIVNVKTQQKQVKTLEIELEQCDKNITTEEQRVEEVKADVAKRHSEHAILQEDVKKIWRKYDDASKKLKDEEATLSRFDDELKKLDDGIKSMKTQITDTNMQLDAANHKIGTSKTHLVSLQTRKKELEKSHPWIKAEQHLFGDPEAGYDFSEANISALKTQAQIYTKIRDSKKKKVNHKVMTQLEEDEKKETALIQRIESIEDDRVKIEETIRKVDGDKNKALMKTWQAVTQSFGEIFGELLPGNTAKLVRSDPDDISKGLEVKVRLGSVWKESLTELSGGQRSLIALSLIMSLLKFKPAPMYILDEIDAALDLSHTQHIGQLFKTKFKGSQFIVVSLKEGLFTNANVLFRAKFREGTSVVERTAQRSDSAIYRK